MIELIDDKIIRGLFCKDWIKLYSFLIPSNGLIEKNTPLLEFISTSCSIALISFCCATFR